MSKSTPTDHGRYKFYYERKKEEFFDNELYRFAIQDMSDKYFGNPEKNEVYYEALNRLISHIVTKRFVFADGSVKEGEYQTIDSYPKLEEDLKILQLDGLKDRLEKTSKHAAGDKSIYNGNEEEYNRDLEYIDTNNFAYNRNQMTVQNLKTLGRFGENVESNNPIVNALLWVRNNITAPVNRFIGRGVSRAYESTIKGPSGLYSNKPSHRYKARVDYFLAEERERLVKEGKNPNSYVALLKARLKAVTNYAEGNRQILNAGREKIRENLNKQAEAKLLEDKYTALYYHIDDLKRKFLTHEDQDELSLIKKHLEIALREKESIERDRRFNKNNVKIEGLDQTDAITLEQHRGANKDNVTRVVTGVKALATLGVLYTGPKVKKWLLDNSAVHTPVETSTWINGTEANPGHFETVLGSEVTVNPTVLKICNISEDMVKGLSTAEIIGLVYENLREDKPENLEKINEVKRQRQEEISIKLKEILKIENAEERYNRLNSFKELENLSDIHVFEIIRSFVSNPEYIIKLLENNNFYSKNNMKIILGTVTNGKIQNDILEGKEYPELLRKIQETDFESYEVDFLLNTFGRNKKTLELFPNDKFTYKYNEELILRNVTEELDDEVIRKLLRYNNIPEEEKEFVIANLKELYKINDEILQTVDFRMLTSKYKAFDLKVFTVYPGIQEKICSLSDKELKYLECVYKYCKKIDEDWVPLVSDVLSNIGNYYELIHDDEFSKYIDTINVTKESDTILEFSKFLHIMTSENVYGIESYEELKNFSRQDNFSKMYSKRVRDPKFMKLSELDKMKDLTCLKLFGQDLATVKEFLKTYASDFKGLQEGLERTVPEIEEYVEKIKGIKRDDPKFDVHVKRISADHSLLSYYSNLANNILNTDSMINIEAIFNTIQKDEELYLPKSLLEVKFRNFYVREKNNMLYRAKEEDKFKVGEDDAYLVSGEFGLQLTSIESYASDTWIFESSDSKTVLDWDCKKVKTHGISSVFCGNANLSLPPIHGICYGFENLHENSLLKSAPWDLGAWSYNKDFDILRSKPQFGTKFLVPKEQLKHSLRRHNEDVIERRNLNYRQGDKYFKLQPSYLISFVEPSLSSYFKEDTEEVLTSEKLGEVLDKDKFGNREYQISVVNKELLNDPKWEKTKQESERKGLKKCVVDRTHTMIEERLKNDEKERKLLEFSKADLKDPNKLQEFLDTMEDIIVEFDESRAGCIQKEVLGWNEDGGSNYGDLLHKEMYEKLFSYKVMDDKLGKIQEKINGLDEELRKTCYEKLKDISKNQVEKISNSYWWYEYDTSHDWYHYYKHAGRTISGINFGEDDTKITELLDKKMPGTEISGGEYVNQVINEIKYIHEYDLPDNEPDWHGRKHINNVVLFSYLIAQNEQILEDRSLDLLIQAAKYHDVGRDGIWNGQGEGLRHDKDEIPHAHPSADAAEYYMSQVKNFDKSRKYSDEEIAMVKVAIEYHEVNEKNKNEFDKETFENLCRREGVTKENYEQTRLLCVYLKDADALDRTRFVYEEKDKGVEELQDNLDITYLRTNTAIGLRDFARKINDRNYEIREELGKSDKNIRRPEILDKYNVTDSNINLPWDYVKRGIKTFKEKKASEREESDRISIKKIRDLVYSTEQKTDTLKSRNKFKDFTDKVVKFFKQERE